MGPSKGMSEIISAAEAPLIASTSYGLTWSAPNTVPTTWTSLRKSDGNDGRNGRSISRQVRIADSGARPSRRKNDPGIFPAAYMRSSMSTVSGKKSMPSRTCPAAVAVMRMRVSPSPASTAPPASGASLPVSNEMVFASSSPTGASTRIAVAMWPSFGPPRDRQVRQGQFPVVDSRGIDAPRPPLGGRWQGRASEVGDR